MRAGGFLTDTLHETQGPRAFQAPTPGSDAPAPAGVFGTRGGDCPERQMKPIRRGLSQLLKAARGHSSGQGRQSSVMMQWCPHCRRPNPGEAADCYFDGAALDGQRNDGPALDAGLRTFPLPLVLPSGRVCQNFNQVGLRLLRGPGRRSSACCGRERWSPSSPPWVGRTWPAPPGRLLAPPIRSAALTTSWSSCRPQSRRAPRACALNRPGSNWTPALCRADRRCDFVLHNDGQRLLSGTARCDVPWLSLGDGPGLQNKLFQIAGQGILSVQVVGRCLRLTASVRKPASCSSPMAGRSRCWCVWLCR